MWLVLASLLPLVSLERVPASSPLPNPPLQGEGIGTFSNSGGDAAEQFRSHFPADFISEAIDQTRGWFYSQLAGYTASSPSALCYS
jgi:hypothetical protein